MKTFPVEIATGNGLGVHKTSFLLLQNDFSNPGLGAASIRCFHNIATGNLVVFDRPVICEERNFPVEFQYVYNSQAGLWRLAHKQLIAPASVNPLPQTMVIVENDSHESVYTWSVSKNCYLAPVDASGKAVLRFDAKQNTWIWFHPETRVTEYYDIKGRLTACADASNREIIYEYNDKNPQLLTDIKTPGNHHYSIVKTILDDGSLEETLSVLEGGQPLLLQKWNFDAHGKLVKTTILSPDAGSYIIEYGYHNDALKTIRQTDCSVLAFTYKSDNTLVGITHGTGPTQRTMEFQGIKKTSESIHEAKLGCYSLLLFTDSENRLTRTEELKAAPGFSEPAVVTGYTWKDGQIESIVTPDGGVERFTYHPETGIKIRHQLPCGQDVRHSLDAANDFMPTNTIETLEDSSLGVHRKVFDYTMTFESQRKPGAVLRFSISPEGRVTEYRYDAKGDIQSERTFLDNRFTGNHAPETCIGIEIMEKWAGAQDASRVRLVEYKSNDHGQITETITFASVDEHGNGIHDEQTGLLVIQPDIHGTVLSESTRQSLGYAPAVKKQTVDALQRPLTVTDALFQTTRHTYDLQKDHNTMQFTVHPDGSEEAVISGNLGMTEHWQKAMQDERQVKRTSTVTYSNESNCSRTVKTPDGLTSYEFLNGAGDVVFTVNEAGRTTRHHHDQIRNVKTTTVFGKEIPQSSLLFQDSPTTTSLKKALTNEILNNAGNREEIECHDLAGRPRYRINTRGALTEYRYDNRSNRITTIQYARFVTSDEINLFKSGGEPDLPVNPKVDRCIRSFYDKDGLLIAEQDSGGFVTEYIRNGAGWIIEEIRYAARMDIDFSLDNFSKIRPAAKPEKDAHTYHFHNNRGLVEITISPEHQVTEKSWLANGLIDKTRVYANAVSPDFYQNPRMRPSLPEKSMEDTVIQEKYDLLDRNIHTIHANDSFQQKHCFHEKTGLLLHSLKAHDAVIAGSAIPDGDNCRAHGFQYNGFGEAIAEATPLLAEKIAQVEQAKNIAADRKAEITDILWKHFSNRKVYDDAGLLLKTITSMASIYHEPVRNITEQTVKEFALDCTEYIHYDRIKRPVFFLTPLADGRVLIREHTLNVFDEITAVRNYAQKNKPFPPEKITTLQGGLLTEELENILDDLKDDEHDPVVQKTLGKTGLPETIIDARGFVRHLEYNAFDECTLETRPDTGFSKVQEFDTRGLVTRTEESAPDMETVTTRKTFAHPLGKCTEIIHAAGLKTTFTLDRNGLETERVSTVDGQIIREQSLRDTLGRIRETIDPMNVRTGFHHARHQSEVKTARADGAAETETHNIHGETIEQTDGAGNAHRFTHAANGVETCHRTPLDAVIQNHVNLHGDSIKTIDHDVTTLKLRDESGEIQTLVEDCNGENRQTRYDRNSLNQASTVTDAAGLVTENTFNKNGATETVLKDPKGLKLLATFEHDASNSIVLETRGTPEKPDQYKKTFSHDALMRATGETVDPDGLKLQKKQILNASGRRVVLVSPSGDTTWQIHDAADRKRFEISPSGSVKEWRYNASSNITAAITYHHRITEKDLKGITSVATPDVIAALLKPDARLDGETCWFYDTQNRERFEVNILFDAASGLFQGLAKETQYNKASLPVKKIHYARPVAGTVIPKASLADIESMVKIIASPEKDSEVLQIFDADKRLRFTLDAERYLHEIRYDVAGRIVTEITYHNRAEPAALAGIAVDEIAKSLKLEMERDTYHYKFYDALGRMVFEIEGEGSVTGYQYDKAGNQTVRCLYDKKLTIPTDYHVLKEQLKTFMPNPEKDHIHTKTFDAANRCIKYIDACGAVETYVHDAMGNITERTDATGKVWKSEFDRANREEKTHTPFVDVADIRTAGNKLTHNGKKSVRIASVKKYDKNSNLTAKILAAGTNEERQVFFHRDSNQNLVGTTIPDVPVDNGAPLKSGFRAETLTAVSTEIMHDARNKKIASCNEDGVWTYFIRDNLGRITFTVKPGGAVIQKVRDTAGRVIRETAFATRWMKDGMPALNELTTFSKTCITPDDRTTSYVRDKRGNPVLVERGMVYEYIPNIARHGTVNPVTLKKIPARKSCLYDASGRIVSIIAWLNSIHTTETITKYDRAGNIVMEAVGSGMADRPPFWQVNLCVFNSFNERTARYEHATLLNETVTADTSLETVKSWLATNRDIKDRHYGWEYDNAGRETAELKYNVTRQELILAADGKPQTKHVIHKVLTISRTIYNLSGLPVMKTLADGSYECLYYDACRNLIARTGATLTNAGLTKPLTPLTFMEYNHHGQIAVTTRFSEGTAINPAPDILPQPLSRNTKDPQELKRYNCRGKPVAEQDAKGHTRFLSWTASNRQSRDWETITSFKKSNSNPPAFIDQVSIDSTIRIYDIAGLVTSRIIARNNITQSVLHASHTIFQQLEAEWSTPEEEKNLIPNRYNNLGHRWFFVKDGVPTISLCDITGQEVWTADSPVKDKMASLSYDDIPKLLSMSPAEVQVTQKGRDRNGLLRAITSPVINQTTPVNQFDYDVWHNQTLHRNAEGFETESTWNDADRCVSKTLPPVRIVTVKGEAIDNFRPKTTFGHNTRDEVIAESCNLDDGSIKTQGFIRDAVNPVMHILPDGSKNWQKTWNTLGQNTIYTDARGNSWAREYDLNGNLYRQTSPLSIATIWAFNERNEMISMENGEHETCRYTWDAAGNLYESFLPMGDCTLRLYDAQRNLVYQQNPDGRTLQWRRGIHGQVLRYVDLGGGVTTFTLNGQNRVVERIRTNGQTSPWYDLMPQKHVSPGLPVLPTPQATIKYAPQLRNAINLARNQHLEYRYHPGGQPASVIDQLRGLRTDYTTNLSGKRTGVRFIDTVTGKILHNQEAGLDALGREYWIRDDAALMHRGFTATSDVRFMLMHVTLAGKTADSRGFWWDYDINSQLKICGIIEHSKFTQNIVSEYHYEKGLRTADISTSISDGKARKTKLTYVHDNDRRLWKTSFFYEDAPNPPIAEVSRVSDKADRIIWYHDTGINMLPVSHYIPRNPNGHIIQDIRTRHTPIVPTITSVSTFNYQTNSAIPDSCVKTFNGNKGTEITRYATWAKDTISIFRVNTERTMEGYEPSRGESILYTGPNGELSTLMSVVSEDASHTENRFFTTMTDGSLIEKITVNPKTYLNPYPLPNSFKGTRIFSTLDGEPLGEMNYLVDTELARAAATGNNFPRLTSSIARISGPCKIYGPRLSQNMPAQNPFIEGTIRFNPDMPTQRPLADNTTTGEFYGVSEDGAATHMVDIGESYESIAKKIYGNVESAWLIALVNGEHRLFPGMHIKIPYLVPGSHYHADSSLPYQRFVSIMQGSLSPWLPANELLPGPKEKHRFLKRLAGILAVAVALMLTVGTGGLSAGFSGILSGLGPQLAGLLGVGSSVIATSIMTGAVAGFINAWTQGMLAGFGIGEFSIAQTVGTALTAGTASWLQATSTAATVSSSMKTNLLLSTKAAGINAAEQLMLMSIGRQGKFDFAQVTTAALGAVVDARLAGHTKNLHGYPKALVHNTAGALVTGAVRKNMDLEQLAAQLVSSTIIHAAAPAVMHGVEQARYHTFKATSSTPASTQNQSRTIAKKETNASKDNIYNSERNHLRPGMSKAELAEFTVKISHDPIEGSPASWKRENPPEARRNTPSGVNNPNSNNRNRFWHAVDTINDIGDTLSSGLLTLAPQSPLDVATLISPPLRLARIANVAIKAMRFSSSSFFKTEEATSKAIPSKALQTGSRQINTVNAGEKSIANPLHEALKNAKPTMGKPNQIEAVLDDGTKVIFRRDIGEHAHEIKRGTGVKIDHYNIEIQVPGAKAGRYNSKENLHIVVDNNLNFVEAFTSKNGVLKDVQKLFNQSKP